MRRGGRGGGSEATSRDRAARGGGTRRDQYRGALRPRCRAGAMLQAAGSASWDQRGRWGGARGRRERGTPFY